MSTTDRYGLLFELSRDAVAEIEMVDQIPVVRAVNPAFVEVFGYEHDEILDESLNEFIVPDHRTGEATDFDQRTARGEDNWALVSRQTADGVREFLYRGVSFEDDGECRGLAIYTDVTEQQRRKRHHQVLHRVLRHNLRNDLTQIFSAAGAIDEESDEESVKQNARRILAAAEDLESLSSAASKVEDLLGGDRVKFRTFDVADSLQNITDRYREKYPEVTLDTDLPETLSVTADQRLSAALEELIENALEHGASGSPEENGTSQTPTVRVELTTTHSDAVVTVTDDGPGIPEYERAAVFDERPLSQLSHGSGLGLWLTKWVVESYGGVLTYDRRGSETTVAARVPLTTETEQVPGRQD